MSWFCKLSRSLFKRKISLVVQRRHSYVTTTVFAGRYITVIYEDVQDYTIKSRSRGRTDDT